jgi:biopolymer transport protein ExbD
MAFGEFQGTSSNRTMSEINMVPLIDIVLVLLVLFILAAPMAAQSVKIRLPQTAASEPAQKIDSINIYLQPDGSLLNENGIAFDLAAMAEYTAPPSADNKAAPVRIWSDQDVRYEHLANLIVDVRNKGYQQISLMTKR